MLPLGAKAMPGIPFPSQLWFEPDMHLRQVSAGTRLPVSVIFEPYLGDGNMFLSHNRLNKHTNQSDRAKEWT